MIIQNKTLRTLGTIGGVVLSILLVAMLIAVPLYSVTASVTKPATLVKIVQEIDFVETVLGDEDIQTAMEKIGIQEHHEIVQTFIESGFVEKTAALYTGQVADVLLGKADGIVFTEEDVEALAGDHIDELVDIVYDHVPATEGTSREQVKETLSGVVSQYSATVVQALPDSEAIQQLANNTDVARPLALLVSPTVPVVLYSLIGVLAALIFVCLLHRFGGLLCLGIDALVAAVPLVILYAMLAENGLVASLLASSEAGAVLTPVLTVLAGKVLTAFIVLAVVGALLIAGYTVYTQLQKKQAVTPVSATPMTE